MSADFTRCRLGGLAAAAILLSAAAVLYPSVGHAAGALAVAVPDDVARGGFSYGFSRNVADTGAARSQAIEACRTTKDAVKDASLRSLCKVVETFTDKCVAVAWDPAPGTPGVGWAVAADLRSAERQAIGKCRETAGSGHEDACVVDNSDCDGTAK